MGTPEDECDGAGELAAACMTIRIALMLRRGLTQEGEKARRLVRVRREKTAKSTTTWANFERGGFEAQSVLKTIVVSRK